MNFENIITNNVQKAFRVLLGAFLLFAGVSYLIVAQAEFLAQVPSWVPLDGDLVVVLCGTFIVSPTADIMGIVKYWGMADMAQS
jgi:hypothetical protein